jgi:AraC-like DNA-binding protein
MAISDARELREAFCTMSIGLKPLAIPMPPPGAMQFRSDDLDEVRDFVGRAFGDHSRVTHQSGALNYSLSWLSGTSAVLGWGRVALEKTVRGAVSDPVLHLTMPTGSEYRLGRSAHAVGAATATFLAPGLEFTRRSPAGQSFVISVQQRKLADEIEARCAGGGGDLLFRTRPIELDEIEQSRLVSAAVEFSHAMGGAERLQILRSEARLVSAVADTLLRESAVARARATPTQRITGLETWIEAHLHEPITIGRLCAVAGVGERSLQKSFVSRRGMSPMRFVTERRLAAARRQLMTANGRDVTSVALQLGFCHVGRFAQLYRQAFGEAPSESLRQASRRPVV